MGLRDCFTIYLMNEAASITYIFYEYGWGLISSLFVYKFQTKNYFSVTVAGKVFD